MRQAVWAFATMMAAVMAFGAAQSQVELPEGPGKTTIETTCASCHGLDSIVKDEGLPRDRWKDVVQQMIQYGADVKEDQAPVLVQYLTDYFGEGRKILDTKCTTCHSLNEVTKFQGFYKREDWQDVVTTMLKYGADVKETEIPVLVEYLTRAYSSNK
jgi:cytochrome c5